MLRSYNTKVKNVLACQILETGKLVKTKTGFAKYTHKGRGMSITLLEFKMGKLIPEAGDFIIFLSDEEKVLCKKDEFLEKYDTAGMIIK